MRRFLLFTLSMLVSLLTLQGQVRFRVADGISDGSLKQSIETSLSVLLTEFNQACAGQRPLYMNRLNLTKEAQASLSMLWENVRFECPDPIVVERVLETPAKGYQVRNIPIEMHPIDTLVSPDELYKEAVVEFNEGGKIESFYFGLDVTQTRKVLKSGSAVTDSRQRKMILNYVEHFRTAYNQKDSIFIEQVFSDDAIIITGKVTETRKSDVRPLGEKNITYVVQNKKQYISRLKQVFRKNKYINVVFEELQLASHPTRQNFYGVTVKQYYTSSTYSDVGYLFLLWDFRDEEKPKIHVRTWQPYWLDEKSGKELPEDEIYDISSFDLSSLDY